MKRIVILTLALCAAFTASAQPSALGSPWSLRECIQYALDHNLSVQQGALQVQQREIDLNTAKNNRLPGVSAGASQMWSFGRSTGADNVISSRNSASTSFNLNASLLLFDGLGMKFAIDQARASMQSSEASVQASELQLRLIKTFQNYDYKEVIFTAIHEFMERHYRDMRLDESGAKKVDHVIKEYKTRS